MVKAYYDQTEAYCDGEPDKVNPCFIIRERLQLPVQMPVRCTGRKRDTTSSIFHCALFYIYPILINIDNKVILIITFCRIKFGPEEANLAFFVSCKRSFAWNILSIVFFSFLENIKISLFFIEVKVYIKIGTLLQES